MLISVIVPIYKVEKYLPRCLDSIINQTYKDLEIILVPQPGGDECEDICKDYEKKDNRIRVYTESICGPGIARNVGIDHAKGKFISFVDADDLIEESYIERLVALQQEYEADFVMCRSYPFMNQDELQHKRLVEINIDVMNGYKLCEANFMQLYGCDMGVVMTKLYKMELLEGIRFPSVRYNEDEAFLYQVYWKAQKVVVTSERLYNYQSHRESSITHSDDRKLYFDSVESSREQLEFFKQKDKQNLYYQALYIHCNILTRARGVLNRQERKNHIFLLEHKAAFRSLIRSNNVSIKRKILVWLGYIDPSIWMGMWRFRNYVRWFQQWKIKGEHR